MNLKYLNRLGQYKISWDYFDYIYDFNSIKKPSIQIVFRLNVESTKLDIKPFQFKFSIWISEFMDDATYIYSF